MDLEDQVPILILDVLEADVSQNTGVVDEDVDATERLDGSVDNLVTVLYRVVVCDGLSACLLDLIDNDIGGLVRGRESGGQLGNERGKTAAGGLTFEELPSPLKDPPRSFTTTLAPREPKKVAYAFPRPPPAPVTTTTWPSYLNWPAMLYRFWLRRLLGESKTARSDYWRAARRRKLEWEGWKSLKRDEKQSEDVKESKLTSW